MRRSFVGLAIAAAAAAACGVAAGERTNGGALLSSAPGAWRYDVTVAADLSRIDVRFTLPDPAPARVMAGVEESVPYLRDVVAESAGGPTALSLSGDGFATGSLAGGTVLRYSVDAARLRDELRGARYGRDIVLTPGHFLLRPVGFDDDAHATLSLHLPDGVDASVPWPRAGDGATYVLDSSAFRWRATVVFGPMTRCRVEAAGAAFDVAVLDRACAASVPGIEKWISAAAQAVSGLYRGFPAPHVQVVVRPAASGVPVAFGETQRGGGAAVVLYLGQEADDASLPGDWVAVHEFTHLGMPAIRESDAWLSEGFVTYYTEVLRARAGLESPQDAWREIVEGFGRGRDDATRRTLADDSATMTRHHTWMRVYWGGAAVGLLADVALSRAGDGRTLDDAMREVSRAFLRRGEVSADRVLAHLDSWLGRPLFAETAAPILASADFPDVAPTLAALGVVVRGGAVTLDDTAPLAAVRRAIVAGGR